jgi:hypothetical protein
VRVAELQFWDIPREMYLRTMLGVAILVLNVADVLTTQMTMARGAVEVNPISAWLIEHGILAPTKIAVAAFIAVAALAVSGRRRLLVPLSAVAGIYTAVVISNSLQLVAY